MSDKNKKKPKKASPSSPYLQVDPEFQDKLTRAKAEKRDEQRRKLRDELEQKEFETLFHKYYTIENIQRIQIESQQQFLKQKQKERLANKLIAMKDEQIAKIKRQQDFKREVQLKHQQWKLKKEQELKEGAIREKKKLEEEARLFKQAEDKKKAFLLRKIEIQDRKWKQQQIIKGKSEYDDELFEEEEEDGDGDEEKEETPSTETAKETSPSSSQAQLQEEKQLIIRQRAEKLEEIYRKQLLQIRKEKIRLELKKKSERHFQLYRKHYDKHFQYEKMLLHPSRPSTAELTIGEQQTEDIGPRNGTVTSTTTVAAADEVTNSNARGKLSDINPFNARNAAESHVRMASPTRTARVIHARHGRGEGGGGGGRRRARHHYYPPSTNKQSIMNRIAARKRRRPVSAHETVGYEPIFAKYQRYRPLQRNLKKTAIELAISKQQLQRPFTSNPAFCRRSKRKTVAKTATVKEQESKTKTPKTPLFPPIFHPEPLTSIVLVSPEEPLGQVIMHSLCLGEIRPTTDSSISTLKKPAKYYPEVILATDDVDVEKLIAAIEKYEGRKYEIINMDVPADNKREEHYYPTQNGHDRSCPCNDCLVIRGTRKSKSTESIKAYKEWLKSMEKECEVLKEGWAQIPESKYYKAKHQEEVSLKKKETESNIEEIKSGQDEKKRQKKKVEIRKLLEELHGVDPRKVPFGKDAPLWHYQELHLQQRFRLVIDYDNKRKATKFRSVTSKLEEKVFHESVSRSGAATFSGIRLPSFFDPPINNLPKEWERRPTTPLQKCYGNARKELYESSKQRFYKDKKQSMERMVQNAHLYRALKNVKSDYSVKTQLEDFKRYSARWPTSKHAKKTEKGKKVKPKTPKHPTLVRFSNRKKMDTFDSRMDELKNSVSLKNILLAAESPSEKDD